MALIVADRVQETCAAPGTGTVTLLGAVTQYQSFSSAIGANNTTFYVIADQSGINWEVGIGTIGATGLTLARTNILASSNGGSIVNFSAGLQNVWCDYSAVKAIFKDAAGNISNLDGSISTVKSINFNATTPTVTDVEGLMYWNDADSAKTMNIVMASGAVVQQVGEEQYYRIKASSAITNGQVIMFSGTVGASGGLYGAPATGLTAATASYIMGIATEDIALNAWGYVTSFGLVRGINTTGGAESWVDGDILYYNPSVAGGLTKTLPTAPNAKVQVAAVVHAASGGSGSLFIRPSFGGILGQYEGDVGFTSIAAGNLIRRNAGNTAWENVATIPNSNLANSSITINGSAISLGGTVSVGTVTSVAASVPTGLSISGSPITGSGTLAITYTAGYAIPTTAKQTEWDTSYTYRVPSGGIIIWSGASTAIPSGWFLCDGLNGTPDLRDRFVVGAGSTYAVGATGGSANATLVSHTHTATSTFTGNALGTHNHTASFSGTSVTPAGSISSTFTGTSVTPAGSVSSSFTGTSVTPAGSVSSSFTGSALATHNHTASFSGSALGTHTHTATSTVTDPGHFHDLPGNTSSGSIRQTQIGVNATSVLATSSTKVTGITVGTTNTSESAGTPAGTVTNTAISAGTPAGSVSSSFTGTAFTPAGSVSSSFTGTAFTPAGSVSSTFTGTAFTPAGSVTNTAITAGTPTGSVSTSNSTEGSSATNANLPPYYALCYIMKS